MVAGIYGEDSITINVDGNETNNLRSKPGAAFVFVRGQNGTWSKQAYLKADNNGLNDQFGFSVGISGDLIIIGAPFEDSNSVIIDSGKDNNDAANAGAAYVFKRSGSTWHQQAYLKAPVRDETDFFGQSVALSNQLVVVGAFAEDSESTGTNNDVSNNFATDSGAVYAFKYVPTYNIGGNLSGLADVNSIVLRNNNGDDLTVNENGNFTFLTQLSDLSNFVVTVQTQSGEPNQDCVVTGGNTPANNGSGTVSAADITNIVVTCTTERYSFSCVTRHLQR